MLTCLAASTVKPLAFVESKMPSTTTMALTSAIDRQASRSRLARCAATGKRTLAADADAGGQVQARDNFSTSSPILALLRRHGTIYMRASSPLPSARSTSDPHGTPTLAACANNWGFGASRSTDRYDARLRPSRRRHAPGAHVSRCGGRHDARQHPHRGGHPPALRLLCLRHRRPPVLHQRLGQGKPAAGRTKPPPPGAPWSADDGRWQQRWWGADQQGRRPGAAALAACHGVPRFGQGAAPAGRGGGVHRVPRRAPGRRGGPVLAPLRPRLPRRVRRHVARLPHHLSALPAHRLQARRISSVAFLGSSTRPAGARELRHRQPARQRASRGGWPWAVTAGAGSTAAMVIEIPELAVPTPTLTPRDAAKSPGSARLRSIRRLWSFGRQGAGATSSCSCAGAGASEGVDLEQGIS